MVPSPDETLLPCFFQPRTKVLRQNLVEPFAQESGQRGRLAARRNGKGHTVASHDATKVSTRVGGIVNGVDEDVSRFSSCGHLPIYIRHRGCDNEPDIVEINWIKGTPLDANTGLFNVLANVRGDDTNIGLRRQQLIQL